MTTLKAGEIVLTENQPNRNLVRSNRLYGTQSAVAYPLHLLGAKIANNSELL
jgi:hypothetical protein